MAKQQKQQPPIIIDLDDPATLERMRMNSRRLAELEAAMKGLPKPTWETLVQQPSLITGKVAEQRYHVTRKTLRQHIKAGTLTDHRTQGHGQNDEILLDEREVAARWNLKPTK